MATLVLRPSDNWMDENGLWTFRGLVDAPTQLHLPGYATPQVLVVVEDPFGDWHHWPVTTFFTRFQTSVTDENEESRRRPLPGERQLRLDPARWTEVTRLAEFLVRFRAGKPVLGVTFPARNEGRNEAWEELSARLTELGYKGVSAMSLRAKDLLMRRSHDDPVLLLDKHERKLLVDPLDLESPALVSAARAFFDGRRGPTAKPGALYRGLNNFLRDKTELDPETFTIAARKRVIEELSRSRATGEDTRAVEAKGSRPKGKQGRFTASLPFESLQLDAWRVDCEAFDQYGKRIRLWLLVAIDTVTRKLRALRFLADNPKMRDVKALIFDTVKGRPIWPIGEPPCPRLPTYVDLWPSLVTELRGEDDSFEPVGTLHVDNGGEFVGRDTIGAATQLVIHMQPARPGRGSDKPHVESFFSNLALFVADLPGATGSGPDKRGAAEKAILGVRQLEVLLRMWAEYWYHEHPHGGLSHAEYPGVSLSPNHLEALLLRHAAGLTISADPFVAWGLLPLVADRGGLRVVHDEGIRNRNRDYDSGDTQRAKEYSQGAKAIDSRGLSIREHPQDPDAIGVRRPDGLFLVLRDRNLHSPPAPLHDALEADIRALLLADARYNVGQFAQFREALLAVATDLAAPATETQQDPTLTVANENPADDLDAWLNSARES